MIDVAVIGAGPAGLASAAAILQVLGTKTTVQVFDRAPELTPCGAGFSLVSNGFSAIEAISPDLLQHVYKHGTGNMAFYMHTADGNVKQVKSSANTVEPKPDNGKPEALTFGWSDLRDAFSSWLPSGMVQLNKRFASMEQHADHVVVCFADGTSVAARVVVGADGCFSKVRRQNLQDGIPQYQGTVFFRARLPMQDDPRLPTNESHTYVGRDMTAVYYPIANGHCTWAVGVSEAALQSVGLAHKPPTATHGHDGNTANADAGDLAEQRASAGRETLKRCKMVWRGEVDVITHAINATDPATALEHSLYTRHPDSLDGGYWGVGPVTLVGDAAHPMRPTGQGLNQGMEDAYELAQYLKQGGLTADSLRQFEASRIPKIRQIMAAELVQGLKAYAEDGATRQKAQSLCKHKWAKAIWEGEFNGPARKEYLDLVLHREL